MRGLFQFIEFDVDYDFINHERFNSDNHEFDVHQTGGLVEAKDLYVSIAAATTMDQFKSSIEAEALEGSRISGKRIDWSLFSPAT
jgi:hypothetical protein